MAARKASASRPRQGTAVGVEPAGRPRHRLSASLRCAEAVRSVAVTCEDAHMGKLPDLVWPGSGRAGMACLFDQNLKRLHGHSIARAYQSIL